MARGWESKAIEEQQAESARKSSPPRAPLSPQQAAEKRRRESLELARKHILEQIRAASHPNHRKLLENSLAELEAKLAGQR